MIRPEMNNKVSLIGLLGSGIIVPQIPTVLSLLGIVQKWQPTPNERAGTVIRMGFELRGPGLAPVRFEDQETVVPDVPHPVIQVGVQLQGLPITQDGEYEVITYINGEQQRNSYQFSISVPRPAAPHAIN